jgi:hypothetical protein
MSKNIFEAIRLREEELIERGRKEELERIMSILTLDYEAQNATTIEQYKNRVFKLIERRS